MENQHILDYKNTIIGEWFDQYGISYKIDIEKEGLLCGSMSTSGNDRNISGSYYLPDYFSNESKERGMFLSFNVCYKFVNFDETYCHVLSDFIGMIEKNDKKISLKSTILRRINGRNQFDIASLELVKKK